MINQRIELNRLGSMRTLAALAIGVATVVVACSAPQVVEPTDRSDAVAASGVRRAEQLGVPGRQTIPLGDAVLRGVEVASFVEDVGVESVVPPNNLPTQAMSAELPRMAKPRPRGVGYPVPEGTVVERAESTVEGRVAGRRTRSGSIGSGDAMPSPSGNLSIAGGQAPSPQAGNGLPIFVSEFPVTDFDSNANTTGFFSIPPDSHIAAGSNHVVTVVNTSLQVFDKQGGRQRDQSLRNFFAPLGPLTGTFDPRVLFDTQSGRWIVVTLEQTDRAFGNAADTSRIFVAASDDADPAGQWFMTAIDARTFIAGSDRWADYPSLGVDEEAIYIATNMFEFFSNPGSFGGVRLWIIPKAALYAGQAVNVRRVDPYAADGFALTTQPAQFYGDSSGVGGVLLGYSGLNDGTSSFAQVMRVNNPLGAIQIVGPQFVNLGSIDDLCCAIPNAQQQGSSELIATNDRRMLNATWIGGKLYGAFTVRAGGQATAHWVELTSGASATPTVSRQADIPGDELGAGTHTFFPAVAANERGDVVVGYSASGPSISAGAYYSIYAAGDELNDVRPPQVLRAGLGAYVRKFGTDNRWGDYSGAVVDPVDGCFWIFNQFASTPGTPVQNSGLGRWATAAGKVCLAFGFAQAPDTGAPENGIPSSVLGDGSPRGGAPERGASDTR